MIDNAREEQDVRDLSNFLALLLKGAEVTHGTYVRMCLQTINNIKFNFSLIIDYIFISSNG